MALASSSRCPNYNARYGNAWVYVAYFFVDGRSTVDQDVNRPSPSLRAVRTSGQGSAPTYDGVVLAGSGSLVRSGLQQVWRLFGVISAFPSRADEFIAGEALISYDSMRRSRREPRRDDGEGSKGAGNQDSLTGLRVADKAGGWATTDRIDLSKRWQRFRGILWECLLAI